MSFSTPLQITESTPHWLPKVPVDVVNFFAKKYNFDPKFLAALVMLESGGNTNSCRFEPGYTYTYSLQELSGVVGCSYATMEMMQKTSWGLMQVMGGVAYELGLASANKEQKDKWATTLLNPVIGMDYGCRHLSSKRDKYGDAPHTLYAAYNAGSPRLTSGGLLANQRHVDRFMYLYRDLTGVY